MTLNVTIPVYNEAIQLEQHVRCLNSFLVSLFASDYEIVIASNGSTDDTNEIAHKLTREFPHIRLLELQEKGRGNALKIAWTSSTARILSYMDVDLSTDLGAFPLLIKSLNTNRCDLAIGSRLIAGSATTRCWQREIISRGYNAIVRACLRLPIYDCQCGFKAITANAAKMLMPLIDDTQWFFDTELLYRAHILSYSIAEIPVRWIEDPGSTVKVCSTAWAQLRGIFRLLRSSVDLSHAHVLPPRSVSDM
jgi:glycosyltransferase involved in cell wall biosynthesis